MWGFLEISIPVWVGVSKAKMLKVKLEFLGVGLKLRKAPVGKDIFWNNTMKATAPLSFNYSQELSISNFSFHFQHIVRQTVDLREE